MVAGLGYSVDVRLVLANSCRQSLACGSPVALRKERVKLHGLASHGRQVRVDRLLLLGRRLEVLKVVELQREGPRRVRLG